MGNNHQFSLLQSIKRAFLPNFTENFLFHMDFHTILNLDNILKNHTY